MTNGCLFRTYIGAQSTGVKFTNVPIERHVKTFDFILSFGVDVERRNPRTTTNGVFSPFWDTANFTPKAVREIKAAHPNVRVIVGIGGDNVLGDHNTVYFTPTAALADSWVDNAFTSLRDIIDHYGLDGVDVDYEHFAVGTDVHTFSSCIGRLFARLKTHYTSDQMFTSIAPYPQVQDYYRQLWTDHHSVIDVVNFQFYRDGPIPDVATYLRKYNEQTANYPGAKVLASFRTGSGPSRMNVKPEVALEAAKQLAYRNMLPGIFVWSADNANGFFYIDEAQRILYGTIGIPDRTNSDHSA